MPAKYPCGVCSIGVKYSAIKCTGACGMWHHIGCQNILEKTFKKLTPQQIQVWQCKKCQEIDQQSPDSVQQPVDNMEDIHSKIQNFEVSEDLETSLSLAAEVGNALLAENSKIKKDLLDMTLRNSHLAQQITETKNSVEVGYEAKIEELEYENKALQNRNATLLETLTEVEYQLEKEKKLRAELSLSFEQHDIEKEKIICNYEKEIKLLNEIITNNKKYIREETNTTGNSMMSKLQISTETQTPSLEAPLPSSTSFLLTELTQIKIKQNQMEHSISCLQTQTTGIPSERQPTKVKRKRSTLRNKTNVFSVSLQAAKHRSNTVGNATSLKRSQTMVTTNILPGNQNSNTTGVAKDDKKPPMTAKILTSEDTYESFLNREVHIQQNYFPLTHHRKPYLKEPNTTATKTSKTATGGNAYIKIGDPPESIPKSPESKQPLTSATLSSSCETTQYFKLQQNEGNNNYFLGHTQQKNTKFKTRYFLNSSLKTTKWVPTTI